MNQSQGIYHQNKQLYELTEENEKLLTSQYRNTFEYFSLNISDVMHVD